MICAIFRRSWDETSALRRNRPLLALLKRGLGGFKPRSRLIFGCVSSHFPSLVDSCGEDLPVSRGAVPESDTFCWMPWDWSLLRMVILQTLRIIHCWDWMSRGWSWGRYKSSWIYSFSSIFIQPFNHSLPFNPLHSFTAGPVFSFLLHSFYS